MFHHTDAQSPWDRRANFGFRCVKLDSPPTAAAAAHVEVTTRDYWNEKPVSDDVFKAYTALYGYDKGESGAGPALASRRQKIGVVASVLVWAAERADR
jgi:hypothetical protein